MAGRPEAAAVGVGSARTMLQPTAGVALVLGISVWSTGAVGGAAGCAEHADNGNSKKSEIRNAVRIMEFPSQRDLLLDCAVLLPLLIFTRCK